MEVVCQTEYQDVYHIKSGVLLVVNKFRTMLNENGEKDFISTYSKHRPYHAKSKDLRILTDDYYYTPTQRTYKAGQIIYGCYPVELVDNKEEWSFQVKTTGDALSGTFEEITLLLTNILEKVCETNERIIHSD